MWRSSGLIVGTAALLLRNLLFNLEFVSKSFPVWCLDKQDIIYSYIQTDPVVCTEV